MNIEIYCDGSNEKSDGSGDGGYGIVLLSGKLKKELCGHIESPCTNNKAEFTALLESLHQLKQKSKLKIYSDSQLVIMYFYHIRSKRWQRKNVELAKLAEKIDALLDQHEFEMIHVKGHNGNIWNERCDELANYGRINKLNDFNYYKISD